MRAKREKVFGVLKPVFLGIKTKLEIEAHVVSTLASWKWCGVAVVVESVQS